MWSVIFYYFTITVNNLFSKLYLIKEKWTIMEFRFNKLDLIFKLRKFLSENLSREKMNRLDVFNWRVTLENDSFIVTLFSWENLGIGSNFLKLRIDHTNESLFDWISWRKAFDPDQWFLSIQNPVTVFHIAYMRPYDSGQSMSSNGRVLFKNA